MANKKDVDSMLEEQGISPDSLPSSERQALEGEIDAE
jgi:hypothetical protein